MGSRSHGQVEPTKLHLSICAGIYGIPDRECGSIYIVTLRGCVRVVFIQEWHTFLLCMTQVFDVVLVLIVYRGDGHASRHTAPTGQDQGGDWSTGWVRG